MIIKDVPTYLRRVEEVVDSFHCSDERVWFRGQSSANWGLTPKLYRGDEPRKHGGQYGETTMFLEFRRRAPLMANDGLNRTDEDWYYLMRQHGLPTRHLDWSTNALVALFFAIYEEVSNEGSAVWVVDPESVNYYGSNFMGVYTPHDKMSDPETYPNYMPVPIDGFSCSPPGPWAVTPSYVSKRMEAQDAMVVIFGSENGGLDEYLDDGDFRLEKIEILPGNEKRMLWQLRRLGITRSSLFPDLDGLAREIGDEFGWG